MAVAPNGAASVIWVQGVGGGWPVQAASRAAGATSFGAVETVSPETAFHNAPAIGAAADGTITAAFTTAEGGGQVQVSTRVAGASSFGARTAISTPGNATSYVRTAVAPDGEAVIAWTEQVAGTATVRAAMRAAGTASFGAAQTLSLPGDARTPAVAIAPDGSVVVVWKQVRSGDPVIMAATRPAGGSFGTPEQLSAVGPEPFAPQVAAGADGTVAAVWRSVQGGLETVQSALRPPGATVFDAAQVVAGPGTDQLMPDVVVAPDGATTVTWNAGGGGADSRELISTRWAGASAFDAPTTLSTAGRITGASAMAVASDGAVLVAWSEVAPVTFVGGVVVATRLAGSRSFGAAQPVGDQLANNVSIGLAADGTPTVSWTVTPLAGGDYVQVATGSPITHALRAVHAGTGTGTVSSAPAGIDCAATCSGTFALSSRVTLTATATNGAAFAGWSGACTGTAPTCVVTMSGDREATATFSARRPGRVARARLGAVRGTSASIRWQAPATSGGAATLAYQTRIRRDGGRWSPWVRQSAAARTTWFTHSWSRLAPRTDYRAQVRAVNRVGAGKAVTVAFRTGRSPVPGAPGTGVTG